MKNYILIWLVAFQIIATSQVIAQSTLKVLFLGNSYTGANNLPQLVHDLASSVGDSLVFDSNTPGGYTLLDHAADVTSQTKIMTSGWNYVVLQGQSQEPVTHNSNFFGGCGQLNTLITQYNPCSVTMLYMTWGRKNGDASNCPTFPVMCTYAGMDSTLRNKYTDAAVSIKSEVSPVSVVWKYLRQNNPAIELYQTDESHPSAAGSYAAACCFYTTLFKKDPTLITFNFGLSSSDAATIRNAVKSQVFINLNLWDYKQAPKSDFLYSIGSGTNEAIFGPVNNGLQETYFWDFGDGVTSTLPYTSHSYLTDGTYTVSLTTTNCDLQGLHSSTSDTVIQFCSHTPTVYTSHSWLCQQDTLWTQAADTYQWFCGGIPIAQTIQYLSNFQHYNSSGFSVLTSLNGCSELSETFAANTVWSGYYFDAVSPGDPCIGDTLPFAVLYSSGSLTGFEIIRWYKNDTLLPLLNNEDTLFINSGGAFECKVVNPTFTCPLDTTSFRLVITCDGVGIKENVQPSFWSIYPNPASESISIKFKNPILKEQLEIYNASGSLLKVADATAASTTLSIVDLPSGLYFIRLKNKLQPALKFSKE